MKQPCSVEALCLFDWRIPGSTKRPPRGHSTQSRLRLAQFEERSTVDLYRLEVHDRVIETGSGTYHGRFDSSIETRLTSRISSNGIGAGLPLFSADTNAAMHAD